MRRRSRTNRMKRAFSQADAEATAHVEEFDIRRLDKAPKSQIHSLQLLHEAFTRNLASSLSAYLRTYVVLNLASVEQISYKDFVEQLPSPSCIAYLGLQPYEGSAVLDINSSLAFRIIELLLGSREQSGITLQRKITDIEKKLLHTILRVVLHDLRDSWSSVAEIDFSVQSLASEPQLLNNLTATDAVIVTAIQARLGATEGLIHLAIPSLFVKRLRNNFDDLHKARRAETSAGNQLQVANLLQHAKLSFDVQVPGGELDTRTLFDLKVDDLLVLDHPKSAPLAGFLNGRAMWQGHILEIDGKMAFQISRLLKS
jgi:flagellar motor switch protein FliM